MDLELTDRRAIVTGASRGIGLATARALAGEGVDLVLASRGAEALEQAASSVAAETGRTVLAVPTDTTDDDAVRALVERAVEQLGGVDILVNSAARTGLGTAMPQFPTLAQTTDADFLADIDAKVLGYLRTARAVAPHLVAQGWGRIINVSGLGARQTNSIARTIRNVSVAALSKNLADELGPSGVNVTVVHPGTTRTESLEQALEGQAERENVTPEEVAARLGQANSIGRIVTAQEVASVIAFLASPRSVAITGDAVAVGGGQRGVVHY